MRVNRQDITSHPILIDTRRRKHQAHGFGEGENHHAKEGKKKKTHE